MVIVLEAKALTCTGSVSPYTEAVKGVSPNWSVYTLPVSASLNSSTVLVDASTSTSPVITSNITDIVLFSFISDITDDLVS